MKSRGRHFAPFDSTWQHLHNQLHQKTEDKTLHGIWKISKRQSKGNYKWLKRIAYWARITGLEERIVSDVRQYLLCTSKTVSVSNRGWKDSWDRDVNWLLWRYSHSRDDRDEKAVDSIREILLSKEWKKKKRDKWVERKRLKEIKWRERK